MVRRFSVEPGWTVLERNLQVATLVCFDDRYFRRERLGPDLELPESFRGRRLRERLTDFDRSFRGESPLFSFSKGSFLPISRSMARRSRR